MIFVYNSVFHIVFILQDGPQPWNQFSYEGSWHTFPVSLFIFFIGPMLLFSYLNTSLKERRKEAEPLKEEYKWETHELMLHK